MVKIKVPRKITPNLAEETGWHIGDGSMNYYRNNKHHKGLYQLRGHLPDDIEHYEKRVKVIYKTLYDISLNCHKQESTGIYGFQIWSNELVDFKRKLGLPLGKKEEIGIPRVFLANKRLIRSIIRGIYDTDGCLYLEKKNKKLYPRVKITTTSKRLALQLVKELEKLKLRATKYETKRKNPNWSPLQNIEVRGEQEVKNWFQIIQPKNPKFIQKYAAYTQSLDL